MFSDVAEPNRIPLETREIPVLSTTNEVKNKVNLVFDIFKQLAQDPINELHGRNYWCENDPQKSLKKYLLGRGLTKLFSTLCGVTYGGLMSALNGNNYQETKELNVVKTNDKLDTIINQIIHNGQKLLTEIEQDFFAYGFNLDAAPRYTLDRCGSGHYSGHVFVVIQYLDEKNEIRYRFFQSFVMKYTLNEYLSKNNNDFSHDEFLKFLEELENFISSKNWTTDSMNFHKKYFHTKGCRDTNWVFPSGIPLEINWKKICVENVITQKTHYEQFKNSTFFPKSFIK